jgi:predicted O-methyltransferase YrrM
MRAMSARSLSPRLRRSIPRPVRELAQRAVAIRHYDAGVVDLPPPRAKRAHLLSLFRRRGHDCFVEAGTYLGDTVAFFLPHARRVISVELDEDLWRRAAARFAGDTRVQIVHGDAEEEIPRIVSELGAPALVWLDGHYSGADTTQGQSYEPAVAILERLSSESVAAGTTIVVDDLRLFGTLPEFPSLEELTAAASAGRTGAKIYVGLDSLVIEL